MKLTVEKLPVAIGVSIGLTNLLEEGLITGDWLYRAVLSGVISGGVVYGVGRFILLGWRRR